MSAPIQSKKGFWLIVWVVPLVLLLPTVASCSPFMSEEAVEADRRFFEAVYATGTAEAATATAAGQGAQMSPGEPTSTPVSQGGKSAQSGGSLSGPFKPVGFINHGSIAATVMAWTYTPLGSNTPASPPTGSTVSFPPTAPGTWPNSSRFLSLPLGTYTWCYWWEIGDTNNDGRIEYMHAIDDRPVTLDESDSDDTALAESVDLSVPPAAGAIPGLCGMDISQFIVDRQHCDTVSGAAISMGHDTDYVVLRGPITIVTWYIHATQEIGPGVPTELTPPVTVVIPAGQTQMFELVDGRGDHPGDWNIYIWLLSIDG